MSWFRLHPRWVTGILVAVFFGAAVSLRVIFPYDQVFGSDSVRFTTIDAYYYMRLVDNLVHNFPHLMTFDPYFIYPGGAATGGVHFFDWFLALIIWVVGLGSPGQHTVDVIGVYYPVILSALTVVPVYFIGKALFNRWAGVLAAGLVAVMPGEFIGRTILGANDTPAAETLLTTVVMAFLVLAIKAAGDRGLTLERLKRGDGAIIRPLVLAGLGGVFLGAYLLTWQGALLFIFIITLYLVVQFVVDHLRQKPTDYLGITGVVLFLVAFVIFAPLSPDRLFTVSLLFAIVIPIVLLAASRLMAARFSPGYYPVALAGAGIAVVAVFYLVNPVLLGQMLSKFGIFTPGGATAATTLEMRPFFFPEGTFTTAIAWGNFTTGFYISALVLAYLVFYRGFYRRQTTPQENLFLIWSVVMVVATLAQRRFAYYLVVNVALLTAYVCWQGIWYAGLRRLTPKPAETPPDTGRRHGRERYQRIPAAGLSIYHANVGLAVIVVLLVAYLPNTVKATEVAEQVRFAPSDAWQNSLTWLRENSPEPFGGADAYYDLPDVNSLTQADVYPGTAYGVTSWWDYGYWITRIAHRLPSANPGQDPSAITSVSQLFLSQNEAEAEPIMDRLDSSYLVIDYATVTTKFWAIVTWNGQEQAEYSEVYAVPYQGDIMGVEVYYPEYYQCLAVRLFNFDGRAVSDVAPMVITYDEINRKDGTSYKLISDAQQFTSYDEALAYVDSHPGKSQRIVGSDRFKSPVPLEAVEGYELVHASAEGVSRQDGGSVPEVKIFRYAGQ